MLKFIFLIFSICFVYYEIVTAISLNEMSPFGSRISGRIINGTETSIEANPHQVSIRTMDTGHNCGGSIISENWVLTAAHCLDNDYELRIFAGTNNQFEGGSEHTILVAFRHEEYEHDVHKNDIGLILVEPPFKFDATRQPIDLFDENEKVQEGEIAVVTGWGKDENGDYPAVLRRAEIPIISTERCKDFYKEEITFHPGQICAAHEQGGQDACEGDSGGPLTINGRLAGITSWGKGCALPGNPGVYTEIAYFRNWINNWTGI